MSGKSYRYDEINYRLMHYRGTIYKFKIEFSGCDAGRNPARRDLTPSESQQVDRTIGVLVHQKYRKGHLTKALQTKDFLIKCSERPWNVGRKVLFRLRGVDLTVPNFMLLLSVAPKQTGVTAVNGGNRLKDGCHVRNVHPQGETQQGGSATRNGATEMRQSSSSHQGHNLGQQTSGELRNRAVQGPEPLQSESSSSRQRLESSSKQKERISSLSPRQPRKSPRSPKNVKQSKELQASDESPPRQLRKSPRLLPLEESPVQVRRSPTVSPGQFRSTANLSSAHEKLPKQAKKRHAGVSPKNICMSARYRRGRSTQPRSSDSPEKLAVPEVARGNPRPRRIPSSPSSPTKSSERRASAEESRGFLRRSPRLRPVRSSQSSPLKSPKSRNILNQLLLRDPSKPRQRRHSIDSEGLGIVKRLRSTSDVATTEKLLHPLDKEFVRSEYEKEEQRLLNLAKPSTSSAERKAWLSDSR